MNTRGPENFENWRMTKIAHYPPQADSQPPFLLRRRLSIARKAWASSLKVGSPPSRVESCPEIPSKSRVRPAAGIGRSAEARMQMPHMAPRLHTAHNKEMLGEDGRWLALFNLTRTDGDMALSKADMITGLWSLVI